MDKPDSDIQSDTKDRASLELCCAVGRFNGLVVLHIWRREVSRSLPPDRGLPVPPNAAWQLTPFGQGSGSWLEQSMSSKSIFPSLTRAAGAIGAHGNRTGYLLGGYEIASTMPQNADLQGFFLTPGIVSY